MKLPEPGPIAVRAMQDALLNVGVHEEGGENRGKYVETYLAAAGLKPGDPWCMAFVTYRLKQAAKELGLELPEGIPLGGWTPDWAKWGKTHGKWIDAKNKPSYVKPGDLVLFYKKSLGRIGNIGFVTSPVLLGVNTVEGNTNDAGDREGDGVHKKFRRWTDLGEFGGFVRLDF